MKNNEVKSPEILVGLKQELSWHKHHRGTSGKSTEWEKGFITGVKHSIDFTKLMVKTAKK